MSTQQDQTTLLANELLNLTSSLWSIQQRINTASAAWTNIGAAAKLAAFPTAALTTTGGLGAVDGSPNVANPIDTRPPLIGAGVTVAVSSSQLASILTFLQGISTAIGGGAVSTNGAAVQLVALTH